MDTNILVSLITVCFNSANTIEDTIKSVINQTYNNWEHIIVDGGSSDRTIDIVKSYEEKYAGRLRLYQGPDKGIYDAMNKGINYSRGTIVGIINSDDWYSEDAVERIVEAYDSCSGEDKVITGGLNRIRDGKIIYTQMHDGIDLKCLKKGMPLQHPAVFVSKSVYERIGKFDLLFPHIADYDFIWRCFNDKSVRFLFVDSVVSFMREGGASDCLSWKHIWSRTKERYVLRKKHIPRVEAFFSACKFLIKELCFQSLKSIVGTNNIIKLYEKKKATKRLLRNMAHSINKCLMKVPKFRGFLVLNYHLFRRLFFGGFRKLKGYKVGFFTNARRITPKNQNCYFGYYDKTPFSSDGSHFLFHIIKGKRNPRIGEYAQICYATSADNYEIIGKTLAWNSQQGSMLRFITDNEVMWNDYSVENRKYFSVRFNVNTKKSDVVEAPIYDVSDNGKYGLSIDFERLNVDAKGYGYIQNGEKVFTDDTYIDLVDLETKSIKTIITLKSLLEKFPIPEENVFGYFNHLEFNPDGNRFIFIFRYVSDHKRISRLFSSDIEGHDVRLLADNELVSHCTWRDNNHITLWCRWNNKNNYYVIEDSYETNSIILGNNTPNEDGHPTYNKDGNIMITDTYPDRAEYRHLIVYNVENDSSRDIARLYSPILLHGPLRCDFHPRWNPNMKQVVIDSAHEGYRGMYLVDINE